MLDNATQCAPKKQTPTSDAVRPQSAFILYAIALCRRAAVLGAGLSVGISRIIAVKIGGVVIRCQNI